MEETQPKLLNIALIGAQGVGKSALKNKFSNVPIDCDGQAVTLNILESPAETDKTKIDAVLLVCDTNDENAKTKAEEKVLEIKQRYGNDIKIIIVGNYEDNKSDNFASVSAGLRQVAKNGKREYISTSAKTGFQVDYAFSSLARVALDLKPKAPPLTESALAGVLEIKRDGALSYLEKLQRIKGKFGLFDFDKSVMSQLLRIRQED
jgi:GTPase SAR1 family protein